MSDSSDYRSSHVYQGTTYDAELCTGPWPRFMMIREEEVLRQELSRLFPNRIPRYLDVACGTGRITQIVESFANVSFGVDVSPSMLNKAKEKCASTTFFEQDITTQRLPIDPVHLITSFRFFPNAQLELRHSMLSAVYDQLIPGGYFILNDHRNSASIGHQLLSMRGGSLPYGLSFFELRRLLLQHGFVIERLVGIGFWVFRSRWKNDPLFQSRLGQTLEKLTSIPWLGPFAPDVVIVARRPEMM